MAGKTQAFQAVLLAMALGLGGCLARDAAPAEGAGDPAPAAGAADGAADKKPSLPSTACKVIRNAQLSIEVTSPAATESKVSSLVEKLGGYVASSEHSASADEGERQSTKVSLSLRVP